MTKHFKKLAMGIALVTGAFVWQPVRANAADYCREYTRTVYIGNRSEEAYGQACMQPNGDWMITNEALGNNYLPGNVMDVNYVIHDNNRYITPARVVYYKEPHYRYRSQPLFVWNQYGHNWNGHRVVYKKHYNHSHWDRHDRWDRHGRDDHRGRGRGHDHR